MCGGFDIDPGSLLGFRSRVFHIYPSGKIGLVVAFLRTCRQMYHDVKSLLYSANDFRLYQAQLVRPFLRRLDEVNHRSLAVRSVTLNVYLSSRNEERQWDHAICALAENLKNLRHIRIAIDEQLWTYRWVCTRRQSPAHGKAPFLPSLLELKKLPLRTVNLTVTARPTGNWVLPIEYTWTAAQKQEWVQKMKLAILGLD